MKRKYFKICLISFFLLILPQISLADSIGQKVNFFIDSTYDLEKRTQIDATLHYISSKLYFYVDDKWWSALDYQSQNKLSENLILLAPEFENKIYPTLTSKFGSEPKPGIDKDEKITILIHPMIEDAGGYFNSGDGYSRILNPKSNEREMIYLNAKQIDKSHTKSYLAHEFMHLITFNQKDLLKNVSEEVWLNEGRAEYAPTLLGYDDNFEGSNLQKRVQKFLIEKSDSLTEWRSQNSDYGVINLFIQYLVDHYGLKILVDSLQSKEVGIKSLNEALKKNGFSSDFSQIFLDWSMTVLINDCQIGPKYCYLNPNLKNFKITPQIIFLPQVGESTLTIINTTKDWAGNWHKIIGGKNVLKLEFSGNPKAKFKVPYLLIDISAKYQVGFLTLDENQKGKLYIPDFGSKNTALIIIPFSQTKTSGFDGAETTYQYSWTSSIVERTPEEEQELIKELLAQIEFLQKEIARVQAQIAAILASRSQKVLCQKFERDLYFGMMNSQEVRCLQEFLKSRGSEIYSEGLVTGNFLTLTFESVKRYQASKGIIQTGYFGPLTRAAANSELR